MSDLNQFSINKLKIDPSFVNNLPDDPEDAIATKAIISLAHELGFSGSAPAGMSVIFKIQVYRGRFALK